MKPDYARYSEPSNRMSTCNSFTSCYRLPSRSNRVTAFSILLAYMNLINLYSKVVQNILLSCYLGGCLWRKLSNRMLKPILLPTRQHIKYSTDVIMYHPLHKYSITHIIITGRLNHVNL